MKPDRRCHGDSTTFPVGFHLFGHLSLFLQGKQWPWSTKNHFLRLCLKKSCGLFLLSLFYKSSRETAWWWKLTSYERPVDFPLWLLHLATLDSRLAEVWEETCSNLWYHPDREDYCQERMWNTANPLSTEFSPVRRLNTWISCSHRLYGLKERLRIGSEN